jgi:hypothetical protein
MRNMLATSTLALSAGLLVTVHASSSTLPHFAPVPTPTPTPYVKRDWESDYQRSQSFSDALASATSALAEHPSDASSIYSELREEYGTILGGATGCDSSRWARVTDAIGGIDDDGLIDGIGNVFDGLFGDEDEQDDCYNENAGAMSSASVACFGALAAALLVATVLL